MCMAGGSAHVCVSSCFICRCHLHTFSQHRDCMWTPNGRSWNPLVAKGSSERAYRFQQCSRRSVVLHNARHICWGLKGFSTLVHRGRSRVRVECITCGPTCGHTCGSIADSTRVYHSVQFIYALQNDNSKISANIDQNIGITKGDCKTIPLFPLPS